MRAGKYTAGIECALQWCEMNTTQQQSEAIMRVEPIGDKVVVKRISPEEKTAGGIVLPDSAREKPTEGRVISVGDGRLLSNGSRALHQVKEGDRVLFNSYAGSEVVLSDDDLLIMSEDDILAIING